MEGKEQCKLLVSLWDIYIYGPQRDSFLRSLQTTCKQVMGASGFHGFVAESSSFKALVFCSLALSNGAAATTPHVEFHTRLKSKIIKSKISRVSFYGARHSSHQ